MSECPLCDAQGPRLPGPWLTSYEMIDAHRAWHNLRKELMKPIADLYERIVLYFAIRRAHRKHTRFKHIEPSDD